MFYVKFLQKMLQKMEILNFPPLSVELEMSTTAECNPPFVVVIISTKKGESKFPKREE